MDRFDDNTRKAHGDSEDRTRGTGAAHISQGDSQRATEFRIELASSFTAEFVQKAVEFWMRALEIPAVVRLGPYGQIFQELLNPTSALSQNKNGANVLLIRPADWIRDRTEVASLTDSLNHIRSTKDDLLSAVLKSREMTGTPLLVFLCPAPSSLQEGPYSLALQEAECELMNTLRNLPNLHCWTHRDLVRLYPVDSYEDLESDRIGHIPYTDVYFAAIATMLARCIAAIAKPPYKVIAIDCDNTLWKGVCGEDRPDGLILAEEHLQLQRMLVDQHDAGILLCLCTKNNPADVDDVFRTRADMVLRQEHIVTSRINWKEKSSNLRSLADELDLGLDSFIFIDDDPKECAEVGERCPSVLTLEFPHSTVEVDHFMRHVWAFDRIAVTDEARRRTTQYKENRARKLAREQARDLDQFLQSLQLRVDVSPLMRDHLGRVAELLQRTNQFNLTTIRRSAGEVEDLASSGALRIFVVHVADRFGDYGLVGAVFLRRQSKELEVETFLLSCRVLGRGVEHVVVRELAALAEMDSVEHLLLRYRQTPRSQPALEFLTQNFGQFRSQAARNGGGDPGLIYRVPISYAKSVGLQPLPAGNTEEALTQPHTADQTGNISTPKWHQIAYSLTRPADVVAELAARTRASTERSSPHLAPRTSLESAICELFGEVLTTDAIGVQDSFFELGGDSLQAVRVLARIESRLGLHLPLAFFYETPTPEKIAEHLNTALNAGPPIQRVDRIQRIPLSWTQQRLWFLDQLQGASLAYHIPLSICMSGWLNRKALHRALNMLVDRHEILSTTFPSAHGEPFQRIRQASTFPAFTYTDLGKCPIEARQAEMSRLTEADLIGPFDMSTGPLVRARLFRMSDVEHVLLFVIHHIIADGWSLAILQRDLAVLYNNSLDGELSNLPPLSIQYADYAHWQREQTQGNVHLTDLEWWTRQLEGAPDLLQLPTDRPRPPVQSYHGADVRFCISPPLTSRLKKLSRHHDVTLAMTLLTAWTLVLHRLSGQQDIVVGLPVAGRRRGELEALIGFFVNTLAIRVRLHDDPCVNTLLSRVKEVTLGAYVHQDTPFERVVEAMRPVRSLSHHPIFQVAFVLQNLPRETLRMAGLTLLEQPVPLRAAQFDLSLSLEETLQGLNGTLNYATDLFKTATAERMVRCFEMVLTEMADGIQTAASKLSLLNPRDRELVLSFAGQVSARGTGQTIYELFEQQVKRAPTASAILSEDARLTYKELNSRANQLAHYLRHRGVVTDTLVGVSLERSPDLIIALLAILKAGGAYVPLDVDYPPDRLRFMIRDCAPAMVLTNERYRLRLPAKMSNVISLDAVQADVCQQPTIDIHPASIGLLPQHLAYVIYTSGSTGTPKGVMIEHRSLLNLIQWHCDAFAVSSSTRSSGLAAVGFDASGWEIWPPLAVGATLVLAPPHVAGDSARLLQWWSCQELDLTFLPTPLAEFAFSRNIENPGLKRMLVGGDRLRHRPKKDSFELINNYGPTEVTVVSTSGVILTSDEVLHIGRPIANTAIYILDRQLCPVPIGVAGEIYIGGASVARGYLHRPDLTAERFIPSPFSEPGPSRVYKTGDLARWTGDGTIEYLGRNDGQLKIRGFRVELGEIESQLAAHAQIRETVVVAHERKQGDTRLVAYVVPKEYAVTPTAAELRAHLRSALPPYMLPSAFVALDHLPLTPNGKLDHGALPEPDLEAYATRPFEAPIGETEELIASIWKNLLNVERIGRQDDFFELGGHSLLIVQLLEKLRAAGLNAEVRTVFENSTLTELTKELRARKAPQFEAPPNLIPNDSTVVTPEMLTLVTLQTDHLKEIAAAVPGGSSNIQDIYPLAPLQEGLLFHHLRHDKPGDTYVLPTLLRVSSRRRVDDLIAAVGLLTARHDALRTAILWKNLPQPVQVVYRRAILAVDEVTLRTDLDALDQVHEWMQLKHQQLDLGRAPLIRLRTAADPNSEDWYVLLQLHHIVGDNRLQEVVISEIVAHLEGRPSLPQPASLYRTHIAHLQMYRARRDAEAFFRQKLGNLRGPTAPFGVLDVHGYGTELREAHREIEHDVVYRLRNQARRLGVSPATIVHAAFALVLAHTSQQDDVVFGSVLLGRVHTDPGAQRVLGMYINTLPLRVTIGDMTAEELVKATHRELLELLDHEHASLAAAQRCSGIAGTVPLFTALMNFRHRQGSIEPQWSDATGFQVVARHDRTNYPITFIVDDYGDRLSLTSQTDKTIDAHRFAAYMQEILQSLTDSLEQSSTIPALRLSILPPDEWHQVVRHFNATVVPHSKTGIVHELLEQEVQRIPDAIAVVHGEKSLSYIELNRMANQLAWSLRAHGVGPNTCVAICAERGIQTIVGLLATLKAGGGYLPIDPGYPADRIKHMIRSSAARVVLSQTSLIGTLPPTDADLVLLDVFLSGTMEGHDENLVRAKTGIEPSDLLYVIYTSGSTGQPKGVAMSHYAMTNLINWHREHLPATSSRVLQFAALSFDVAFQEIFSTLCVGGTLVLLDEWVRKDARGLVELLRRTGIERLFLPPVMLQSLSEYFVDSVPNLPALSDVITAGEQLRITPEVVKLFDRLEGCRLHNHYGPTETHVVTALTLTGAPQHWPGLPTIGSPIANTHIYILDARREPVPFGVAGEIYVAGANVARGYLDRPDLTAERFIADPYSASSNSRMYKTGDLGRWSSGGNIEYLGRNDNQIKVRGFRIEPGEIETHLIANTQISNAAVVAHSDATGTTRLLAYVTARNKNGVNIEQLRSSLKATLPDHMIPSVFVVLERLPLTTTGKIDRRALPSPDSATFVTDTYFPPIGKTEEVLAAIWQDILAVPKVGRNDNFFHLGGHSLLVLKLLFKVERAFESRLRVSDVYNSPNLYQLAQCLQGGHTEIEFVNQFDEAALDDTIVASAGPRTKVRECIFLTGPTGFVGRFILAQLIQDTDAILYCPVPASSGEQALAEVKASLAKWDLWQPESESRIIALAADPRLPHLGLEEMKYNWLSERIDTIYHSAATMNILDTYALARTENVEPIRQLLKFAITGRPKLINHVSTLGVFSSAAKDPVRIIDEESSIENERYVTSRGYVASRWVAEKLLLTARERGIPCNIFRLGLLWADSKRGRYDESLFGYALLKTCLLSGAGIENYRYAMPPTPVDYVARSISHLSRTQDNCTFHISSPRQFVDGVFERCADLLNVPLELLSDYQWVGRIRDLYYQGHSLPMVPLIQYAFSMDEHTFNEHQRSFLSAVNCQFDSSRTHRELDKAGIHAPEFDLSMLRVCLEDMCARDPDLRDLSRSKDAYTPSERPVAKRSMTTHVSAL